jgi:hypothetical protein
MLGAAQLALPTIQDFLADLADLCRAALTAEGFTFADPPIPFHLVTLWFAVQQRTIPPRPRIVHRSPELGAKALTPVQCLALQTIEAESLAGLDLNPRRSRTQKKAGKHDPLLNDWRLHHLHLGARGNRPDGLADSGSELLFVVVAPDDLHFVDLLDHTVFDYADVALFDIVHRNWPRLLEQGRVPGVTMNAADRRTPEGHAKLRRAGFIVPTRMPDGTVYIGDSAMSGAVPYTQQLFDKAQRIHDWCRTDTSELLRLIEADTGRRPHDLREVHLRADPRGSLFLVESTTGAEITFE